jgi:ankyrin repeat protein
MRTLPGLILLLLAGSAAAETDRLDEAIRNHDTAAVEAALQSGAAIDDPFPDGVMAPLPLAIVLGDVEITRILLDHGASTNQLGAIGMPPLAIAAQSCGAGIEIVDLLIRSGADVNARGPGGMTPLLIAALRGREDVVATLIAAGADASAVDVFGDGMLNLAIYARNPSQVQLALAAGSGTDQLDKLFLTRGYRAYIWPGPPVCETDG